MSNVVFETFGARRAVLPVIHVQGVAQALDNAALAFDQGANGVFLINHLHDYLHLLNCAAEVAAQDRSWWVGVNCLDLEPDEVFRQCLAHVRGVWVDDAGIDEESGDSQDYADQVLAQRDARAAHCLYFGGVAFKYRRAVADLETACRLAAERMDVVTTTGPGTGQSADPEKLRRMRAALGERPLALASGVTPENVESYLPWVDCLLVATGVSADFHHLDPRRMRELVERVQNFGN